MIWLIGYTAVALIMIFVDGSICYASGRRFELLGSICLSLGWPATMPFCIFELRKRTAALPTWAEARERAAAITD